MRQAQFLKQRYKAILAYASLLNLLTCSILLSPLIILIAYPNESKYAWMFILPALALGLPSFIIWLTLRPKQSIDLSRQEGAIIVVLAWILAIFVGAFPFIEIKNLTFTQAIFESTSGWTTAGLSIINPIETPHLMLFYRSLTQLAGGAGLAIIMLSTLAGSSGPGITSAEGRSEQLLPNVRRSARLVLTLYLGYNIAGFFALLIAGMDWFDAINHAFTALSTGGFSTRVESIGYWNSPAIETIIIILMLLGTLNFLTAYLLFQGKLKAVLRTSELKLNYVVIGISFVLVFLFVSSSISSSILDQIRVSLFSVVAALSTTGYSITEYQNWSGFGILILVLLMLIGGGAGSTAGGIKQARIYIVIKGIIWEIKHMLLPRSAVSEPDIYTGGSKQFISDRALRQVSLFILLYLGVYITATAILSAIGYPLMDSLFETASALSTVGLSIGITSPEAPAGVLWTQIFVMFLGRLEFYTIIIAFVKMVGDSSKIIATYKSNK